MVKDQPDFYDVAYGLATAAIAVTSKAITVTQAAFHGMAIVAGATAVGQITLYDAVSTTAGNVLYVVSVGSGISTSVDRYIPIKARYGIYMVATGTGVTGSIFYSPKG